MNADLNRKTRKGGRVVTLTGGTGGYNLVSALRRLPLEHITAIYTVCDNGGSTGEIRTAAGVLPPGDARRLILALGGYGDDTLTRIMDYRFPSESVPGATQSFLGNHSVGNIMLTAAQHIWGPVEGVRRIAERLGARGDVFPISTDSCHLLADYQDGTFAYGETAIDKPGEGFERRIFEVKLDSMAYICPEAKEAILAADVIVLGPGDFYTSIVPILLIRGVADAIRDSNAKILFPVNLMTKHAETPSYGVADFVEMLMKYGIGRERFDAILVNNGRIPPSVLKHYEAEKAELVVFEEAERQKLMRSTKRIVFGDFVDKEALMGPKPLVHHSNALAGAIMRFVSDEMAQEEQLVIIDIDDTLVRTSEDLAGNPARLEHLRLVPGARDFIVKLLTLGHRVVLLSAGDEAYQRRKIKVVGLEHFCRELCVVPTPEAKKDVIVNLVECSGKAPSSIVVIGDRLDHELAYAQALGCKTIRVWLPEGKYAFVSESASGTRADMTITSFEEIDISKLFEPQ